MDIRWAVCGSSPSPTQVTSDLKFTDCKGHFIMTKLAKVLLLALQMLVKVNALLPSKMFTSHY